MAHYVEILARDRPAEIALDERKRFMFSANFEATAVGPLTTWDVDVVSLLVGAGCGVGAVDLFLGRLAAIPPGDGPYVQVIVTGGVFPTETHNGGLYERPSVQVVTRAKSYAAARSRADACWRALHGRRDVTV